jgi:hypothetical protein
MKATVEQLQQMRRELAAEPCDRNLMLVELIDTDLKRRTNGGRPKLDKALKDRNREAARKSREGKKIAAAIRKHLEEKENRRHDKAMAEAGIMPKVKRKRARNRQGWQKVPKVKPDGLHYSSVRGDS